MTRKPIKLCSITACNELTLEQYCDKHKDEENQERYERNKYYDKYVRDERHKFYDSKEWKKVRKVAFKRDNGLCQVCLKDDNKITAGDIVHHIVELLDGEEGWSKRLDLGNLITVCRSCHNRIHSNK